MSLLVTSCTMGKQPDRLLNKGPEYLRTRTNASLFVQHKKSAVELLAASKAQFYNIKESVSLDKQQDLAVSPGQNERYSQQSKLKEPPRSKSEYDLSQLQLARLEDESDENNNDTSDDSINLAKADVLEGTEQLSLQDNIPVKGTRQLDGAKGVPLAASVSADKDDAINSNSLTDIAAGSSSGESTTNHEGHYNAKAQPKLTILRSSSQAPGDVHEIISAKTSPTYVTHVDLVDGGTITIKKPVPLPRKLREKPVPPPRKHLPRTPVTEDARDSNLSSRQIASAPYSLRATTLTSKPSALDTPKLKSQAVSSAEITPGVREKHSAIESLTQRFTALSATSSPSVSDKSFLTNTPDKKFETKTVAESGGTFTATPIFIGKPDTSSQSFQAKPVFITEAGICSNITPTSNCRKVSEASSGGSESLIINKSRKRCPDVPVLTKAVKRERKSTSSDISSSELGVEKSASSKPVPVRKSNSSSTSKSEMSIESVDQAVYESEINAIPSASMEGDSVLGEEDDAREVTRANSSLSGKMEQQDTSPLSLSPTPQCSSTVPRSHSDISCRLEGQHSRDSSIVSNHSRLSRASAGADLENFFNQMGLEKGVLEPISRLRELQTSEVFDSMSSLDSQDAASICSTYSRSEQEWSDTQSMERSQQQTSIVERNARIIKWLCNVRKAKTPQKADSAAAGKA